MAISKKYESASRLLTPSPEDESSSLRSASDQDTDTEDDELVQGVRSSAELAEHDLAVLKDEEELEQLITAANGAREHGFRSIFESGNASNEQLKRKASKREKRRQKRRQQRAAKARSRGKTEEEGALMYELEEGAFRDSIDSGSSSAQSSDLDRQKFRATYQQAKRTRRFSLFFLHGAIVVLFFIFVLAAWQASRKTTNTNWKPVISNGTSLFAQTTILISLDGFRADFLNRNLTPTLNSLIASGVSPKYMLPSFPSVTFPNHFTLVTGLYPESHGVVGNTFWDPVLKEEFYYTHVAQSMEAKWWTAEPLWVTAEKQGVHTGVHMWPGSEAHIQSIDPTYLDKYNGSEVLSRKTQRILELLDLPSLHDRVSVTTQDYRPQLIAAYVPNIDSDGHKYGPNSTEIRATISAVDEMLGSLLAGIEERNLTKIVNVIVVSDHGMATTSASRLIQLESLVDPDLFSHIDGWPLYGLRPNDRSSLPYLHSLLVNRTRDIPALDVYLRDEDMPERFHFSSNERIAPLWLIPKAGWAIARKEEFDVEVDVQAGKVYRPHGLHGYDHEDPLMRAIFVGRGPAFPHEGTEVEPFQNVNVYNIVCETLGIKPRPNNGTLHLPLRHIDTESPEAPTKTASAQATSETIKPSIWDFIFNKVNIAKTWVEGLVDKLGTDKNKDE